MLTLLIRIYALLLMVAYRVVDPGSSRDMQTLAEHRKYLQEAMDRVMEGCED